MEPLESYPVTEVSEQAATSSARLLAEAQEVEKTRPTAPSDKAPAQVPEITTEATGPIKDLTVEVNSALDYQHLLDKTKGSVCSLFYKQSDQNIEAIKKSFAESSGSLEGKATFARIHGDGNAANFLNDAGLADKTPAFVVADNNKYYIHMYVRISPTINFKELIERFERGERKLEP